MITTTQHDQDCSCGQPVDRDLGPAPVRATCPRCGRAVARARPGTHAPRPWVASAPAA